MHEEQAEGRWEKNICIIFPEINFQVCCYMKRNQALPLLNFARNVIYSAFELFFFFFVFRLLLSVLRRKPRTGICAAGEKVSECVMCVCARVTYFALLCDSCMWAPSHSPVWSFFLFLFLARLVESKRIPREQRAHHRCHHRMAFSTFDCASVCGLGRERERVESE